MDTFKFMLPINYNHFNKIYLVTQKDDMETIQFCKEFNNVEILFYNFKNNDKNFDKYGALNMVQKIVYEKYPDHWYLIIDSDIILPNNFIDILQKENLNQECIYGAMRNNIDKSSILLNNVIPFHNYFHNNILNQYGNPPSILGCFQLYFKKNIFHRNDFNNASKGDFYFGFDNFNIFCQLENLVYLHLGLDKVNWDGKIESFNDDCNINLNKIYFKCNIVCRNIYYNQLKYFINTFDFNWKFYISEYKDLQLAGINTYEKSINHWIKYGRREGRICNENEKA